MTGQEQLAAGSDPAGDFSLVNADRELPTAGQVVRRAVWVAIVLVALMPLVVAASAWITPDTTWWPLTILIALLLVYPLLKVIGAPRPRLRD